MPATFSASDGWPAIFGDSGGNGGNRNGYDIYITTGQTAPAGQVCAERWSNGSDAGVCGTAVLSLGWHLFTATYAANNFNLYVDGVFQATSPSSGSIIPNSNSTVGAIGSGSSANSYGYGTVDDLRAYNRALSASEVMALYNSEK